MQFQPSTCAFFFFVFKAGRMMTALKKQRSMQS
jgi:hypothetical protein